ncbi:MAG: HlyD family efflux transporter periplasmic adaptor subunit [Patescibacteria group bacterium]
MPNLTYLYKYFLITAVFALAVYILSPDNSSVSEPSESPSTNTPLPTVQLLTVRDSNVAADAGGRQLEVTGTIEAAADVDVLPEASGVISRVSVTEGQAVTAGQILLEIENTDERIAVGQAQAQLEQQRVVLADLISESDTSGNSTIASVVEQQDVAIENAYEALLNNDLQAYPDDPEDIDHPNPIISGTYSSTEEGTYIIDVYRSSNESGYSFRLRGMESGTYPVSFNQPVSFGSRGLFIKFTPDELGNMKDEIWRVTIPNQRSASYVAALTNYEAAIEGKDVTVRQTEVSEEDIARQQAIVRQQELSVQAAQNALRKTIVRSPISGTLTSFDLDIGDFVATAAVATVKSLDQLEVVTNVTEFDRLFVAVGSPATIAGIAAGEVISVGAAASELTQKVKVRIGITDADRQTFTTLFTEGQSVPITLERTPNESISQIERFANFAIVPLTAIQIIGTTPSVFAFNQADNTVRTVPVETGLLVDDSVLITSGLEAVDAVVVDGRGLSDGEMVVVE